MQNAAILDSIYRYPVKGLSPEPYQRVLLRTGQTLPNDRRYAIENGPSGFDPAAPKWLPKAYFLMLMRNERLAALQTHYDDDTSVLTICHDGRDAVQGNLETCPASPNELQERRRGQAKHGVRRVSPKASPGRDRAIPGAALRGRRRRHSCSYLDAKRTA